MPEIALFNSLAQIVPLNAKQVHHNRFVHNVKACISSMEEIVN